MLGLYFRTLAVVALGLVTPSEEFERGRTAFLRGEYERAVSIIHPLLYPELRLESESAVVQAHRMLGVSYLFENKPEEARGEFRKLLELAPDFRFDPFLDPPTVVEFFNGIVRDQQRELGDIESRLKKREDDLARRSNQVLERRFERRSYAINFVPFGAGQFQNQQRGKGWAFLGVEAFLAATSVGAFITNYALYGAFHQRPCLNSMGVGATVAGACPTADIGHTDEDHSRNLTRLQVASGGLFFGVAIWGVVDAIRNYRAEVSIGETYAPTAPANAPTPAPPPLSWNIAPLLSPVAQGGSLTLTF